MLNKKVSLFSLVMLNITAVVSLSSVAYMATLGFQSVIFYIFAAILFLVPSSMICAELSGMMTKNNGGVFSWVKEGLGEKAGVIAMWLEWFNNVISFPGTISTIIATIALVAFPSLMENKYTLWLIMLAVFWLITLFNLLPMKRVVILNIVGALFGMILPGILLICGAVYYLVIGKVETSFHGVNDLIPIASFGTFALLVKTLSAYSGIQSVAFHMKNIENPQRNVPRSMLFAVVIILLLTMLPTLSLVIILPVNEVNPLNGLVQAISVVMSYLGFGVVSQFIVAFLIGIGMLSALSTWVLGPARGMQEAAEAKLFPSFCQRKNASGMPVNMLLIQVCIGSILSLAFLLMPSIVSAFALLIALTSQFTVLMWIMILVSAIRLRYTKRDADRSFRVGGKRKGNAILILMASLAIIACLLGFVAGLFPPAFSHIKSMGWYIIIMVLADAVIIAIPLVWIYFSHRKQLEHKRRCSRIALNSIP